MSNLKKDVATLREQLKAKLDNFMSKPFLPFAMASVDFIEKMVIKIESLEERISSLENTAGTNEKN